MEGSESLLGCHRFTGCCCGMGLKNRCAPQTIPASRLLNELPTAGPEAGFFLDT